MKVIVVGGGISGLATAHFLRREGHEPVLLEPGEPGGAMGSERRDGFLCERGPQALVATAPAVQRLIDELGLRPRALAPKAEAKRRRLFSGGRLHDLPSGPPGILTTRLLSWRGRLRLLAEPFIGRRKAGSPAEPETLRDFAARRLGPEAADRLLVPAVMAIYAGDARRLEAGSAFPVLAAWERDHGSLFRGALASARANKGGPRGIVSFPEGLGELAGALARELGPSLIRGHAQTLERSGARWRVAVGSASVDGDGVVLACHRAGAASLLRPLVPAAAEALDAIPVASAAIVHLGFQGDAKALGMELDAYGFIVARDEGVKLLGCQYESSIFPERAPPGHVLLRAIVGGTFDPEALTLGDEALVARTCEELRRVAGLVATPVFSAVWRHPLGIPQYTLGHAARVATIENAVATLPGLFITGNALRGVGLADCITRAAACAAGMGERAKADRLAAAS